MAAAGAASPSNASTLRTARFSPPNAAAIPFSFPRTPVHGLCRPLRAVSTAVVANATTSGSNSSPTSSKKNERAASPSLEGKPLLKNNDEEEVEEELPWIQEKALDLVEFTGSVTQAIPGPRVGRSSLPLILAVPLAYAAITFAIAFVRAFRKLNSPREKRKKMVNKNAFLCESIDQLLEKGVQQSDLKRLMQRTGFDMEEILRKYIRYALNEKDFNPAMVASLIHLRKASTLDDLQVAEVLNEISRRIVRDKGPVVMDISGYSEKGAQRKVAVKALFGKVLYLSELPEFCSKDSSLVVKEMFGVTDEDAERLRITGSETVDMDSLEKMMEGEGDNFNSMDS